MAKSLIIGAGLSGLECAKNLLINGYEDFLVLEKQGSIYKQNSWKTLRSLSQDFGLKDCYANTVENLHMRTFDLKTYEIFTDFLVSAKNYLEFDDMAVILDSKKVYNHYEKLLKDKIVLDCEVKGIGKKQDKFWVNTSKGNYESEILVDASGVSNVSDHFFNSGWFKQAAYFTCYGKRFNNCSIPKDAPSFFDFESPELFGTWCYPVNDSTLEIGVSRYCKKIEVESNKDELESLLEKYCKLSPFNEYLKGSTPGEIVKGSIPLLPRPYNIKDGVIFIGDAKGTCYSGQGLFNALYSAKAAAEYLINGKDYKYNVCQPLRNIGFLNMVWSLSAEQFRILFKNITKFSGQDLFKFLTGTIDNEFMMHALKSTPKELMGVIAKNTNKSILMRSFLNGKPKESDYNLWYKE